MSENSRQITLSYHHKDDKNYVKILRDLKWKKISKNEKIGKIQKIF